MGADVLEEILPPCVVAVEAFDDTGEMFLFPEEQAVIARAVDKRRREFTTVRRCARRALAQLGVAPVPILPGAKGAPGWPPGIVGSMSHCAGFRGSAVARAQDLLTLGIDAEEHAPLPSGVLDQVSLPQERTALLDLAQHHPQVCWDRLLFSIKESVYKAWFPLARRWLGFEEAEVSARPTAGSAGSARPTAGSAGSFTVRLLVPGPLLAGQQLTGFQGRWLVRDSLVLTAIAVPAPSGAGDGRTPAGRR